MNPPTDLLHHDGSVLCARCAVALGVDDVSVALDGSPGVQLLWASSPRAARLVAWESSLGEGPCTDAVRTNAPRSAWLSFERPVAWPRFGTRARDEGLRSAGAAPVRLGSQVVGALGVYGGRADGVEARTVSLAGELAGVVAQAIARGLRHRPDALFSSHDEVVPQAAGMVAVQRGVGTETARALLWEVARDERRPVDEVATEVVSRRRTFCGQGPA